MQAVNEKNYRERVYAIVREIPCDTDNVPWQRVINSQGKCSTGKLTIPVNLQQELLEAEGIEFNAAGKCDLGLYQWFPDGLETGDEEQATLFD